MKRSEAREITGLRCVAATVPAVLVAMLLAPAHALADDPPTTVAGLLARYQDLSLEAERVNEELLRAREDLSARRQDSQAAGARAQAARAAAEQARQRAQATYEDVDRVRALLSNTGDPHSLSVLLTSGSRDEVLARVQAAGMAAGVSGSLADEAEHALAEADQVAADAARSEEQAKAAEAAATAQARQVTQRGDDLNRRIAEVRATLDNLTPEQRSLLDGGDAPAGEVTVPVGTAGAVLRYALAQLGKPYLWGAVGPDSYDCSGLVLTAFRSGGVALPRVSVQQSTVGEQVSRAEVRGGDLIFYYQPVHHVAIALDNERAIHAPSLGQNVKIARIDAIGPVTVIRRVIR